MVYIVESGKYDVLISEVGTQPVASNQRGDSFGEVALISSSSTRTATIKCVENGRLWALDRDTYHKMLKHGGNLFLESASQHLPQTHAPVGQHLPGRGGDEGHQTRAS